MIYSTEINFYLQFMRWLLIWSQNSDFINFVSFLCVRRHNFMPFLNLPTKECNVSYDTSVVVKGGVKY